MVSNSLNMDLEELLGALKRLKRAFSDTPEYKAMRKEVPKDWPM